MGHRLSSRSTSHPGLSCWQSMERAEDFSLRQGLRAWDPYSRQRRLAMAASAQGTSLLSAYVCHFDE